MELRMGLILAAVLLLATSPTAQGAEPTLAWASLHDGGARYGDDGYLCRIAPDGNPVVAGESKEATGGVDLLVRKLDRRDGADLWGYRYEGYDDKDVAVTDMLWDSVGQLLVAGFIRGCVG